VDSLTLRAAVGFALALAAVAVLLGCGMFGLPFWSTLLAGLAAGAMQAGGTLWYLRRRLVRRPPKRRDDHGPRRDDQ
jgi:drug/metabolite transporter (DMT)-like permease